MIFTEVGLGYVGMAMSVLPWKKYKVFVLDTDETKLDNVDLGILPIVDEEITLALSGGELDPNPVKNIDRCFLESDFAVVATATDYNMAENSF